MRSIATLCLVLTYVCLAFVLPIVSAGRFLYGRKASWLWIVGMALTSLGCGFLGFWVALAITSQLVPPGHELIINAKGVFIALAVGLLAGVPLGTWSGAWGVAMLVTRLS